MNRVLGLVGLVLLAGVALTLPSLALADYHQWIGTTGDFSDPANWDAGSASTGSPPVARDDVWINNGGTAEVTSLYSIDLKAVAPAVLGGTGTITVKNGGTLDLVVANSSLIQIGWGSSGTGTVNLEEGGAIQNVTQLQVGVGGSLSLVGIYNQMGGACTAGNALVGFGGTGWMNVSGGTFTTPASLSVGALCSYVVGNSPGKGYMVQTGGTVTLGQIGVGCQPACYGYYNLSGEGMVKQTGANYWIGGNSATGANKGFGPGLVEQTGGTLDADGRVVIGGAMDGQAAFDGFGFGVFNLSGGTAQTHKADTTTGASIVGGNLNSTGVLNLSGTGLFEVRGTGTGLAVGWKGTHVAITGGGTGIVNLGALDNGSGAGGGTLAVGYIERSDDANAIGTVNFHGGTLKARYDTTDFLKRTTNYVYQEGAVIDTDGKNVTVATALATPVTGVGQGISGITLASPGMDYTVAPVVKITRGFLTSEIAGLATAIAKVNGSGGIDIVMTNPGTDYLSGTPPTIEILGGDGTGADGSSATVTMADNVCGGLTKKGLGTLTLSAANTYTGATTVEAGTLRVTGSITSDVTVNAAGAVSGTGTITGDVDVNGVLSVAYYGDIDTIDALTIVGKLDLTDATIDFSNASSGTLATGTYVFASYTTLVGDPAEYVGLLPGWSVNYHYSGNNIALLATEVLIPGDANGDAKVDTTDAQTLATNWGAASGATWAMGDFNGDGAVNAADASIMAANWGYGGGESSAVPEPAAVAGLIGLLVAGLAGRRCRRQRA